MNKVGFVFDSTAIVPELMVEKYGFESVSLYLDIDGVSQLSTDIDEVEFIEHFPSYKSLKSASPSPQAFVDAYEKQFAKGFKQIIVLPLSSKISSTHDVAVMAKDLLDEDKKSRVIVLDTLNCSLGFDSLMHSLDSVIEQDLDAEVLAEIIMQHANDSKILFEINDLKNLYRGGRLKKIGLIIGELLGFKPLVEFDDGVLTVIAKNRNRSKNVEIILDKIGEFSQKFKTVYVNHFAFNPDDGAIKAILNGISKNFNNVVINLTKRICPVYISHVGINGYAIAITAVN